MIQDNKPAMVKQAYLKYAQEQEKRDTWETLLTAAYIHDVKLGDKVKAHELHEKALQMAEKDGQLAEFVGRYRNMLADLSVTCKK